MKIWLDDVREMPEGFDFWAKTAEEALIFVRLDRVSHISFDNDLGEGIGKEGYDVAKVIEERAFHGIGSQITWDIHSQNPEGRKNIYMAMKNSDNYWNFHYNNKSLCTCNPYQLENYGCVCKNK